MSRLFWIIDSLCSRNTTIKIKLLISKPEDIKPNLLEESGKISPLVICVLLILFAKAADLVSFLKRVSVWSPFH